MKVKKGDLAIVDGRLIKFAYTYADTNTFRFLRVCTWEIHPVLEGSADSGWDWSGREYRINSNQNIEVITNEVADIWRKANEQL